MLNTVNRLCIPAARFVDDVFISKQTNSLDANENLINKKYCLSMLFLKYFTAQTLPTVFERNEKTYRLKLDVLNAFQLSSEQRRPNTELSKMMQQISPVFEQISIENLVVFLTALLQEKNQSLDDLNRCKSDFQSIDTENTYVTMLNKIHGCSHQCPSCKWPCDFDHTGFQSTPGSKYNEHRCQSGHTLRAMNDCRFDSKEETALLMCEQIKDDQVIVVDSKRWQWSQFKKHHEDWIFDTQLDEAEVKRLHDKLFKVWQNLGPNLLNNLE